MKKTFTLLVLFLGMTAISFAQMTKGSVTYRMDFSTDDPQMSMASSMMAGSTMKISFMPGKSRADITMGSFGTMVTLVDEKTKSALMLMDMMGQKTAMESKTDDPSTAAEKQKYTVEVTSETKDILGYKCTKAILTTEDGTSLIGWYTKELEVLTDGQNYFSQEMPGFPMEFNLNQEGMVVTLTATAVEKKVDKAVFQMKVPEGYTLQTMDELMQEVGGE